MDRYNTSFSARVWGLKAKLTCKLLEEMLLSIKMHFIEKWLMQMTSNVMACELALVFEEIHINNWRKTSDILRKDFSGILRRIMICFLNLLHARTPTLTCLKYYHRFISLRWFWLPPTWSHSAKWERYLCLL